jgi:hypothetical protein
MLSSHEYNHRNMYDHAEEISVAIGTSVGGHITAVKSGEREARL